MLKGVTKPDFFFGGGEMEKLIRAFDWSKTSLGKFEDWPASLKYAVDSCLDAAFPTVLYCGSECLLIYNDAFIPLAGSKHPHQLLGMPAQEKRSDVWPIIGPLIMQVLETGKVVTKNTKLQLFERQGFLEENYITCGFSPVGSREGKVHAVSETLYNITSQILHERRLQTLRAVSEQAAIAQSLNDVYVMMMEALVFNDADIPFALLYILDETGKAVNLKKNIRIEKDTKVSHATIQLEEAKEASIWPLAKVFKTSKPEVIDISQLPSLPSGRWKVAPSQAFIAPLLLPGHTVASGFLIIGVNPVQRADLNLLNFYETIVHYVAGAIANVTALAEERRHAQSIKELDRAKTVFFSNISHEFRTPLQLILGPATDALADIEQALPARQLERIYLIQRNALRLLKLVNFLLDFSRLEAGRMVASYEPTDLSKLTLEITELFKEAIKKANLKFILDIQPLEEPIYVDRNLWEKILFNLLSNALKYTLTGSITVTLKASSGKVLLAVTDTGVGIPEAELTKLFDRFYRVEGVVGRGVEGSGIGLALTQELTKLHGGSLQVESKVGSGSTFTVSIPFGKAHLPEKQIKTPKSITREVKVSLLGAAFVQEALSWIPEEKLREEKLGEITATQILPIPEMGAEKLPILKPKLLFAEDNPDMRKYVTDILGPYYDIHVRQDGESALQAALSEKFDFLLTDVAMPKLSGIQLIQKLRANEKTKYLPTIILSASASDEERIASLERGADDYIAKPFATRELLARIKIHLELSHLREKLETSVHERTKALEQEIAAHKQTEAALAKSEQCYRMLAMISPVGIFHTNKECKIFYINKKGCEIMGVDCEQVTNDSWIQYIHLEDKDRVLSQWNKLYNHEIQHFKSEYRYRRPNGSVVWVIAEAVPEKDSKDQIIGYIGTITDITDVKELEKIHFRRQEQFIDTMCHELRNPLNGIYGNVSLAEANIVSLEAAIKSIEEKEISAALKEKLLNHLARDKETIQAIDRCARHQKTITDDVLNLSKLEAGKINLSVEDFDAKKVIEDVISMLETEINRKHLHLYKKLAHQDTKINSDPDRLAQILLNLLSNAIKFTPEKGDVTISLKVLEETENVKILEFSVEDTGIGMTDEERAQLFNRFVQVGRRTSREYGGSGLGLAISKNIVELMGGKIEVESQKWKGSKFTFTTKGKPVTKEQESKKATLPLPSKAIIVPKVSIHILVVEDNLINQKLLVRLLELENYHCHVANHGKEAVEMFAQIPIDLVLMDIEMPVMNGLEATKAIREIEKVRMEKAKIEQPYQPIPIIALSGNARQEFVDEALLAGMNDYLVKPYERIKLLERIARYMKDRIPASQAVSPATLQQVPSLPEFDI